MKFNDRKKKKDPPPTLSDRDWRHRCECGCEIRRLECSGEWFEIWCPAHREVPGERDLKKMLERVRMLARVQAIRKAEQLACRPKLPPRTFTDMVSQGRRALVNGFDL